MLQPRTLSWQPRGKEEDEQGDEGQEVQGTLC